MDIVVKGRKTDVTEKFRRHASEKLAKVERFNQRIIRLEVEVCEERNPRLSGSKDRVEVTCVSKGPVIRAEAAAADEYAALDLALGKLESRLRRAADKRHVHHATQARGPSTPPVSLNGDAARATESAADDDADAAPGQVVREKTFAAPPMTIDDALHRMELVGHDFFLFHDTLTGLPSVVYRRHGYDYGVIRLDSAPVAAAGQSA
ncbi:MAG: ribosome-associated translation inhibitor RaiA [Frankia sp.]|nr:ribosome-associated translation inhibitor RaiA [Frankia sp.]